MTNRKDVNEKYCQLMMKIKFYGMEKELKKF